MNLNKLIPLAFLSLITIGSTTAQENKTNSLNNSFSETKIKKGTVLISGVSNVSGSSSSFSESDNDASLLSFNLSPSVGYFVFDNLVIGLSYDLQFDREKKEVSFSTYLPDMTFTRETMDQKVRVMVNSLSFFTRYYFGERQVKPYLGLEAGYGVVSVSTVNYIPSRFGNENPIPEDDNLVLGAISGGVNIFVSKNAAIDASLFYGRSYPNKAEATALIGTNIGFSIFF